MFIWPTTQGHSGLARDAALYTIGETIGTSVIKAAADRWAREQHDRHRVQALQWSRKLFVQTATNWLHFLGCLEEPQPKRALFADRLADFAAYQRDERG